MSDDIRIDDPSNEIRIEGDVEKFFADMDSRTEYEKWVYGRARPFDATAEVRAEGPHPTNPIRYHDLTLTAEPSPADKPHPTLDASEA